MSQSQPLPSNEVLRQLQEIFLKAVLTREPLPNSARVVNFPDLSQIMAHPSIFLSNENLFGQITIEGLEKPLCVLSPQELAERARSEGDLAYLLFRPPRNEGDGIRLTLEGRIAPRNPDERILGLSGVQLKFRETDGEWRADDPVMFAS